MSIPWIINHLTSSFLPFSLLEFKYLQMSSSRMIRNELFPATIQPPAVSRNTVFFSQLILENRICYYLILQQLLQFSMIHFEFEFSCEKKQNNNSKTEVSKSILTTLLMCSVLHRGKKNEQMNHCINRDAYILDMYNILSMFSKIPYTMNM